MKLLFDVLLFILAWASFVLLTFLMTRTSRGHEPLYIPPYAKCVRQHEAWFKTASESKFDQRNWDAVAIWHMAWRSQDVRFTDEYRQQMRQGVENMTRKSGLPWHPK